MILLAVIFSIATKDFALLAFRALANRNDR
jgi:hypothetical protein